MTKTTRNTASAAEESFHKHHATIWGEERYAPQSDFHAVLGSSHAVNPSENGGSSVAGDEIQQVRYPVPDIAENPSEHSVVCYVRPLRVEVGERPEETMPSASTDFPQPRPAPSHLAHLMTHWNLDAASALVASVLSAQPGDSVLDLCAAPGGKSIALAQGLWPGLHADSQTPQGEITGRLVCNEADGKRHKRLAENLNSYLPPQLFKQGHVVLTKVDATQFSTTMNGLLTGSGYDRVLVDAPCSSERHIIHASFKAKGSGNTAPEMANWRAGSSKRLAKTEMELLMTALRVAKVGGRVMYATCSIEPMENDGVVEKMLALVEKERKKGWTWNVQIELRTDDVLAGQLEEWAEPTKYGWIVLPDHPGGGRWGPLFFAMMSKVDAR
ncbi:hypothetical protein LTR48_005579 [Friedmanniomyces endolithicus]|uniref:NOL1/NOP2/Sun domain family member 4 n=1 Tax=Rachicladosporium monterosium TaxID=1507873 RepID=A0ABR0L1N9_9PEZI|nr:hypothetical protein LTR48_005579 [Friedmanniomyces endolithicus]KAK5142134.1 hypothetical protein LTR32_005458 [Rachicladosporium monterosium]